jgi:hypothetical protein
MADATIWGRRAELRDHSHAETFRPHMQHVAHPVEGIRRGGFKRKGLAFLAVPGSRIRLHSNSTRVQYM